MASEQDLQPPPYRKHSRVEEMTPEDRLRSLQEFVEQKKYMYPGENGSLAWGPGGVRSLAFGGPMASVSSDPVIPGPPSYERTTAGEEAQAQAAESSKSGPFGKWLEKRRQKKLEKEASKEESAATSSNNAHESVD